MGVGRGLDVRNTLQTPLFLFGNIPLMRSFKLGQHLVKGNREAADLVLALVINTLAVVLRAANRLCDPFELRQRPDDVVMRQKSEEKTQECERTCQQDAVAQFGEQNLDAVIEKAFQLRLTDRPSRDRIVHGRLVKAIAGLGSGRLGLVIVQSSEVRRDAGQHFRDVALDRLPQLSIGISAVGRRQISFDFVGRRLRHGAKGKQARSLVA